MIDWWPVKCSSHLKSAEMIQPSTFKWNRKWMNEWNTAYQANKEHSVNVNVNSDSRVVSFT